MKINKKIVYTAIVIFYIILFALYVIRPLNFDTKMYLGAAYQADLIGSFPTNIFDAWEHKLVLNRIIFYGIHKLASVFVSPENVTIYEMVAKAIYGIFAVGIIGLFTKQTKTFFEKYKINQLTVFSSLYFIVIMVTSFYNMQTEITGLLLLLIPIMLILKEKNIYNVIAGFFISMLFFLKGVTLLYSIIILAVMLIEKRSIKSIIITIASSFIFLIIEIFGIWLFRPNELIETYLSTQYLKTSWNDLGLFKFTLINFLLAPKMVIGTMAFIYNMICHKKDKNLKLFLIEIGCYIVLAIGVSIQGLKLYYQMSLLMPAFLLSFFITIYYLKKNTLKINMFIKISIIIILFEAFITTICLNIDRDINLYNENKFKEEKIQEIYNKYTDIRNDEILYLGNGLSSYYIKTKSYLKYTTTVYLADENPVYNKSEYIKDIKDKIKEYKGKYILLDDIELENKRRISNDIIGFINENYTLVENTGMNIHDDSNDEEYITIYVRNDKLGELDEK